MEYDIKLKDGRYFQRVLIWNDMWDDFVDLKFESILLLLPDEHKLSLFIDRLWNDDTIEVLKEFKSSDIEYITRPYKER